MTDQLTRGRVCQKCSLHAAEDDVFCVCGYEFQPTDPIVDFTQAAATATDGGATQPAVPPHDATVTVATPVVTGADPVVPAPSRNFGTAAVVTASTPDPVPAASNPAPAASSNKIAWIDLKFDLGYRQGRPDDATPPTDLSERMFSLTGKVIPFGRLSLLIPLDDEYTSRQHGYFHRRADGGYDIENTSGGGTNVNGQDIGENKHVPLKDGDRIELGAYTVFEYHEQ